MGLFRRNRTNVAIHLIGKLVDSTSSLLLIRIQARTWANKKPKVQIEGISGPPRRRLVMRYEIICIYSISTGRWGELGRLFIGAVSILFHWHSLPHHVYEHAYSRERNAGGS